MRGEKSGLDTAYQEDLSGESRPLMAIDEGLVDQRYLGAFARDHQPLGTLFHAPKLMGTRQRLMSEWILFDRHLGSVTRR